MMYTASIELNSETIERINRLLAIPCLETMTDEELREAGATTDSSEYIFEASFEDGSRFTYDLCSGESNYFDDMMFYDPSGWATQVECMFELDDEIEFESDGNIYRIYITTEEE